MRLEVEKSGLVASSLGWREARRRLLLPRDLEEEDSLDTWGALGLSVCKRVRQEELVSSLSLSLSYSLPPSSTSPH